MSDPPSWPSRHAPELAYDNVGDATGTTTLYPMLLAVASSSARVIDFFHTYPWKHVGRVSELVAEPHELAPDVRRRLIYCVHTYRKGGYAGGEPQAHEVSVIDADARQVVDVIDIRPFVAPHDVEYFPGTDLIYASVEQNEAGKGLVIIDASSRQVAGHIPTAGRNSHWFALTPDGWRAFVTHKEDEVLSVLDLANDRLLDIVRLPGGAEEVALSPDGRWVFVVTPFQRPIPSQPRGAKLIKIDARSLSIVGETELPCVIHSVRATSDGRVLVSQMYALPEAGDTPGSFTHVAPDPGKLFVIDGRSMKVLGMVTLDRMPFTIRVAPDSSTAYVANTGSGTLSVVDLHTYAVVRSVACTPDRGGTHGLALLPS